MPGTANAEPKRTARENGRRRDAVAVLLLTSRTCAYAARQLNNGLTPDEARDAVVEAAAELEATAAALRRMTGMPGPRRGTRRPAR